MTRTFLIGNNIKTKNYMMYLFLVAMPTELLYNM